MSFRRRLKGKQPPDGWDLIEDTIEDFEAQMRDAVSEEHEGKERTIDVEDPSRFVGENRFIFDLMYRRSDGPKTVRLSGEKRLPIRL